MYVCVKKSKVVYSFSWDCLMQYDCSSHVRTFRKWQCVKKKRTRRKCDGLQGAWWSVASGTSEMMKCNAGRFGVTYPTAQYSSYLVLVIQSYHIVNILIIH